MSIGQGFIHQNLKTHELIWQKHQIIWKFNSFHSQVRWLEFMFETEIHRNWRMWWNRFFKKHKVKDLPICPLSIIVNVHVYAWLFIIIYTQGINFHQLMFKRDYIMLHMISLWWILRVIYNGYTHTRVNRIYRMRREGKKNEKTRHSYFTLSC